MKKIIKLLWWKWIKRGCPHFCKLCQYKTVCTIYNEKMI